MKSLAITTRRCLAIFIASAIVGLSPGGGFYAAFAANVSMARGAHPVPVLSGLSSAPSWSLGSLGNRLPIGDIPMFAGATLPPAALTSAPSAASRQTREPLGERLRRPLPDFSLMGNSLAKQAAGDDFQSRVLGESFLNSGAATPPPAGEPGNYGPGAPRASAASPHKLVASSPDDGSKRVLVFVSFLIPQSEAGLNALIERFSKKYAFQRDYKYNLREHDGAFTMIEGAISESALKRLKKDPNVLDVYPSIRTIESLVTVPYARPAGENLMRWSVRVIAERAGAWLVILSNMPLAIAAYGSVIAAVGAADHLASQPENVVLGNIILGGALAMPLALMAGFFKKLSQAVRLSALAQAAGGWWLIAGGHHVLGALALSNAIAAFIALPRLIDKKYPNGHDVDQAVNMTENNLALALVGFGFMSLAWALSRPDWALKSLLASSWLLASLLAPAPGQRSPKKANDQAIPDSRSKLLAAYLENRAQLSATFKTMLSLGLKSAATTGFLSFLIVDGPAVLFFTPLSYYFLWLVNALSRSAYKLKGLLRKDAQLSSKIIPDTLLGDSRSEALAELSAATLKHDLGRSVEPAFSSIFAKLRVYESARTQDAKVLRRAQDMAYVDDFFKELFSGGQSHWTLPSMSYHLLGSSEDALEAYRAYAWDDAALSAEDVLKMEEKVDALRNRLSSDVQAGHSLSRELRFLQARMAEVLVSKAEDLHLDRRKADLVMSRLKTLCAQQQSEGNNATADSIKLLSLLFEESLDASSQDLDPIALNRLIDQILSL